MQFFQTHKKETGMIKVQILKKLKMVTDMEAWIPMIYSECSSQEVEEWEAAWVEACLEWVVEEVNTLNSTSNE
jgi:hypothetical protein